MVRPPGGLSTRTQDQVRPPVSNMQDHKGAGRAAVGESIDARHRRAVIGAAAPGLHWAGCDQAGRHVNRQLHAALAEAFGSRQAGLLDRLDRAEDGGRWAWIHPPRWKCFYEQDKAHGALVRLMVRDGGCSVFRDLGSFRAFSPWHHGTYLLRDDEVRIRWVGEGSDVGGAWLDGQALEHEAVYHGPGHADSDDSE
jgi:hypothetical protein